MTMGSSDVFNTLSLVSPSLFSQSFLETFKWPQPMRRHPPSIQAVFVACSEHFISSPKLRRLASSSPSTSAVGHCLRPVSPPPPFRIGALPLSFLMLERTFLSDEGHRSHIRTF